MQNNKKAKAILSTVLLVSAFLVSTLAGVGVVSAIDYTQYTGTLDGGGWALRIPNPWNSMLVVCCRGYWGPTTLPNAPTLLATSDVNSILNAGFAVAASNYGAPGFSLLKGVNSTYELTNYLIGNYSVAGKVFLLGWSMGGSVALLLGEKHPDIYSGVLDVYGATDWKDLYTLSKRWANLSDAELSAELTALGIPLPPPGTTLQSIRSGMATGVADQELATGGTPATVPQVYEACSPTYHANIMIPVITVHGTADSSVPYYQSLLYQAAVAKAGRSGLYRLYPIAGGYHNSGTVTAEVPGHFAELVAWSNTLTGSDWPMFRHDLQHTGYSTSPAPTTNQTLWIFTTGQGIWSSPSIANGKVYVGSDDNNVYCLDGATGTQIWNYTTADNVWSSPAIADGKVYVSSVNDKLYCLNANNGALVWSFATVNGNGSSPSVANGKVYFGSYDDRIYCLDASTGAHMWNYTTGDNVWSSPAVVDGKVYVGSADSKVYCLNAATGALLWNYTTGGGVSSSPSVIDGNVYVGSRDNKVYCLNASTGAFVWSYTTTGIVPSSPAVVSGRVYVGSYDKNVYCLDAATGTRIWNYTTGGSIWDSSPAVADGKVYIGSNDMCVWCLNAANGAFIWNYRTGMIIGSSPAVANGVVYVSSYDRKVYAFSASSPISASMWSRSYGGTGNDIGTGDTVQTSDGGYAVSGDTNSSGAGGTDFWLFKTDANGNMQWNKTYGGALNEVCGDMCQTSDGGYAIAGGSYSFGAGGQDMYLVKTDANGVTLWNKTYGGTGDEYAISVARTNDGGYAMTGYTLSVGNRDFFFVKTDASGNMQWNKTYGGPNVDDARSVVQTGDGGYLVAGYTNSFGAGGNDFWLIKTDSFGTMLWNRTYGGTGTDVCEYLIRTSDGGYAMTGHTSSFGGYKAYLVKIDANGNMLWNKTYGTTELGIHGIQTADGGYAIVGWNYLNGQDFLLIKTDAAGNLQWNMTYGGSGLDNGYALLQTSDGGYVLTGTTNSFGAGGSDVWLAKVDAAGVIPEFPSWLILSFALAATGLIAIGKKRLFRSR